MVTHNHQSPFIRRIEWDLKDLGMSLLMPVKVLQVPASKAYQTSFRSVSEDGALVEWHVRLIELDTGIQSSDVNRFAHSWRIDRKGRCIGCIVVRLEGRVHLFAGPDVGDCHLIPGECAGLVRG